MSLDPRFNKHHSEKVIAKLRNLDSLEQVAAAAGHGYAALGLDLNAGWTQVAFDEENVRPSYDLNHIHTFSPALVQALLFELSESRKALTEARKMVQDLSKYVTFREDEMEFTEEEILRDFDELTANIPKA